jgi:hypothetical protein
MLSRFSMSCAVGILELVDMLAIELALGISEPVDMLVIELAGHLDDL